MAAPKPNLQKMQEQVDAFNKEYKIGDTVHVRKDDDSIVETTVRYEAEILQGHTAVGWFTGFSGCYLLERVTKLYAFKENV